MSLTKKLIVVTLGALGICGVFSIIDTHVSLFVLPAGVLAMVYATVLGTHWKAGD